MTAFEQELTALLNRHSMENASDTPDFILARFLCHCLKSWNHAQAKRRRWYGEEKDAPETAQPKGQSNDTE